MLNYIEARNEIESLFTTRFNALAVAGLPDESAPVPALGLKKRGSNTVYIPEIRYQNRQERTLTDAGQHWLRLSIQNITSRQKSFTGGRAEAVGTMFTTQGVVRVEIYFSKSAYQSNDELALSLIVQRCFVQANTPCGVWFRNPVIVELEPLENYFRSDVLAEYQYDSVIK